MNDTELENLLRSMKPVTPSPELAERVRHDLDLVAAFRDAQPERIQAKKRPAQWFSNLAWASIGAAAAVAVMGFAQHGTVATANTLAAADASVGTASAVMPVSSTREWLNVEDMGISYATPDSPTRQMKLVSMERHQWVDPRDGAEYTVELPQEEAVALPIQYQ